MAFDARFNVGLAAQLTNALDLTTVSAPLNLTRQINLQEGTGLNSANRIWHDERTIAASGTDDLDLSGVLSDPFGATITLARVKGILISAAVTNSNNVVVGTGSNPLINWLTGTTPAVVVRPGGLLAVVAPDATGYAVTAGTGDILRIANSAGGTSVTYQIVIIGANA